MITILQGSDFHFGKPYLSQVEAAFHKTVLETNPDVIVLTGDFTQRAKIKEYHQAREFLKKLPDIPTIVTPGNHDVPLYRVHERIFSPLRNYRNYVSADLNGFTRVGDVVFVDLCSADPYRAIVNGRLSNKQVEFAARIFQGCSPEDFRILVTHHSLFRPDDGGSDNVMPKSSALLARFRKMGIGLILSGHIHRNCVMKLSSENQIDSTSSETDSVANASLCENLTIVHCGTTTSNRGRMAEKGKNSLNVLQISSYDIVVTPHWFEDDPGCFVARASTTIAR